MGAKLGVSREAWPIVSGQYAAYSVFIGFNTRDIRAQLGDSDTTESLIAAFYLYDGMDNPRGGSFRAGLAAVGR